MQASTRKEITPENVKMWEAAKAAYLRDGNLDKVLAKADMTEEHVAQLIGECQPEREETA